MKKYGVNGILGCLAALLSIVAIIAGVISHNINTAYRYTNLGLLIAGLIVSICLIVVTVILNGNKSSLSVVTIMASVIALVMIAGNMIIQRILLIGGLFSYNSQNTIGWQVFYATVVAAGCMLVAAILMIITAFTKNR